MLRLIPPLLILVFTVYTVVAAIQTDESSHRNLPKMAWILLILAFPLVGGLAWWLVGRPVGGVPKFPTPQPRSRPRPPRGPDDDPDFLKNL